MSWRTARQVRDYELTTIMANGVVVREDKFGDIKQRPSLEPFGNELERLKARRPVFADVDDEGVVP